MQQAASTIAAAIRETIYPVGKDEGCEKAEDRRNSDLCAQWKAADAARDAADYSLWSLLVGIFGTAAVVATLHYTRKAVIAAEEATEDANRALEIASRNADAAARQVEVSEQTAHRQLRAYLSAKSVVIDEGEHDDDIFTLNIEIVNNGQTPAVMKRIVLQATWTFEGGSTDLINIDLPNMFKCHRDVSVLCPLPFQGDFEDCENAGHIVVIGRIDYEDAFGALQKEEFSWRTQPSEYCAFYDHDFPHRLSAFPIQTMLDMIERDERKEAQED